MAEIKLFQGKAQLLILVKWPVEVLVIVTACAPDDIEDQINAHQAQAKLSMEELGLWIQSKGWGILVEQEGVYFNTSQEPDNASQ